MEGERLEQQARGQAAALEATEGAAVRRAAVAADGRARDMARLLQEAMESNRQERERGGEGDWPAAQEREKGGGKKWLRGREGEEGFVEDELESSFFGFRSSLSALGAEMDGRLQGQDRLIKEIRVMQQARQEEGEGKSCQPNCASAGRGRRS